MTYSPEELEEIERDPERLRAYFWRMARHWQRLAKRYRAESRATGELHPVTNYRQAFDDGAEKVRWAGALDCGAAVILENLDAMVESTLVSPDETAPRSP